MSRWKSYARAFVLVAAAAAAPDPATGSASCPPGTREQSSACVLDSDLVLGQSLELQSFTTLNCRGHRVLPFSPGSGTTPASYVPSVPALAIAITGERGVTVKNCVIGEKAHASTSESSRSTPRIRVGAAIKSGRTRFTPAIRE